MHAFGVVGVWWYLCSPTSQNWLDASASDPLAYPTLDSINTGLQATEVDYPIVKKRLDALEALLPSTPPAPARTVGAFEFDLHLIEPSGQQLEAATLDMVMKCELLRSPHGVRLCGVRANEPSGINAIYLADKIQHGSMCRGKKKCAARLVNFDHLVEMRPLVGADSSDIPDVLENASPWMRGDRDTVLAAIAMNEEAMKFASDELKGARDFVLVAANHNKWRVLQFASAELQVDRDIVLATQGFDNTNTASVLAAVTQNWHALQFASVALKEDRDVMLNIVTHQGRALQLALGWGGDREIVLAAVKQNPDAFQHASETLKHDAEIVRAYDAHATVEEQARRAHERARREQEGAAADQAQEPWACRRRSSARAQCPGYSMQMMQVTVPAGVGAGQAFLVTTPNGSQMQVVAPMGSMPGTQITIQAPTVPVPVGVPAP